MKRTSSLAAVLLAGVMLLAASQGWAQDTKPAPPDVDGTIWMQSTPEAKRSFLFGAGSAFVLEYYICTKHDEVPSKFVMGWVEVLKNKTWGELVKALDTYYTEHPDRMHEHVFKVIWQQLIEPNMKD